MTSIFVAKESRAGENRVAATPETVSRFVKRGFSVFVEASAGYASSVADTDYTAVGAEIVADYATGCGKSDLVLKVARPTREEGAAIKKGSVLISFMQSAMEPSAVQGILGGGGSQFAMELVPRTTLAQKMDALSSQANLAGYVSVLQGASALGQILPMMMTPAGTLKPARVFVIGVGVAGLQAIATAKRLGARVEAFDTRPEVAEQVQSLGAKFVKVDLGETGQTKDGYAKALTEAQRAKQQEAMAEVVAQSALVITTAQVFGRRAPILITDAMLAAMRPGSVVVDGAVDSGGNVEGVVSGENTLRHGVTIVGLPHLSRQVSAHASQMYGANIYNLIEHFWDKEQNSLSLDTDDEIMDGCLIVSDGEIRNEMIREKQEAR
ncbi:MAG: NAD(P) transhydrogenase subunit alpha [Candidatus Hydrogenedentes bacterium]|nr:NAD(P) transhydrogenase subunit alpha [Candidatus Hydrogenedentota bacterium]